MRTDTIWSRAASGTRHEAAGERAVTAESYAAELAKMKAARPGVRVAVYDHIFWENRAWFRFTFRWRDPETSNPLTQAGMQSYRIEDGKLAEIWIVLQPVGSSWPDAVAQEDESAAIFKLMHYPLFTTSHSSPKACSQLQPPNMPRGFKGLPGFPHNRTRCGGTSSYRG